MTRSGLEIRDLHDDDSILSILEDDRAWAAYALSDLDPPYRRHARFIGAIENHRARSLVLVYAPPGLRSPILPFGEAGDIREIVRDVEDLPERAFLIARENHIAPLRDRYEFEDRWRMLRMVLAPADSPPDVAVDAEIKRLTKDSVPELTELYRTLEAAFFDPATVEHGYYFGAYIDDRMVAVAGTHTVSPRFRVGTIGGVFTDPEYRGRGLAKAVSAAVVRALIEVGCDLIALNVREDNPPAISAYRTLGFRTHFRFWEGPATLR